MVEKTIDAISSRSRKVDGTPTSLADLGYQHVGVDDGWQACKTGKDCTFHADDGAPLVNTTKFPDLSALVKYGEAKQVLVGWYQINCICCDEFSDTDNATWKKSVYTADVKQLTDAGFYGVKLDDCGDGTGEGLIERVRAINASGRAMLIENSNQGVGGPAPAKPRNGRDNPKDADAPCPFNLFRTGGDIIPDFGTVIAKLQRTIPYLGNKSFAPISRPGCWAYPDSEFVVATLPPGPTFLSPSCPPSLLGSRLTTNPGRTRTHSARGGQLSQWRRSHKSLPRVSHPLRRLVYRFLPPRTWAGYHQRHQTGLGLGHHLQQVGFACACAWRVCLERVSICACPLGHMCVLLL
jgi:hypothetical protein